MNPFLLPWFILITAIKGGTTKTAVALNLTRILSKLGIKSGYVDIDLDSPNATERIGLRGEMPNKSGMFQPLEHDGVKYASPNFFFGRTTGGVSHRGEENRALVTLLLQHVNWSGCQVVVVDTPAGASDEYLAAISIPKDRILGILVVVSPVDHRDFNRVHDLAANHYLRMLGVVESYKGYVITKCGSKAICGCGCGREVDIYALPDSILSIEELCAKKRVKYWGGIPLVEGYPGGTMMTPPNPWYGEAASATLRVLGGEIGEFILSGSNDADGFVRGMV